MKVSSALQDVASADIMGSGSSKTYSVYNSDTTYFWDYELQEGASATSLYRFLGNHYCATRKTKSFSHDQILEQLKKDGIDGVKIALAPPLTIDDPNSKDILSRLTYLSFTSVPGPSTYLLPFLQGANLRKLELIGIKEISEETWDFIANARLEYFNIYNMYSFEPTDTNLTDDVLRRLCHNTQKYSLADDIVKRIINIPGLAELYIEKTYGCTPNTSWVEKREQIPEFIHLLKPGAPLFVDSVTTSLADDLINEINASGRKVRYLGLKCCADFSVPVEFTETLHIWDNIPLRSIKQIVRISPGIKKITSGFDAITADELEDLKSSLSDYPIEIKI